MSLTQLSEITATVGARNIVPLLFLSRDALSLWSVE